MLLWITSVFHGATTPVRRRPAHHNPTGASDLLLADIGVTRADLYCALLRRFR